MLGKLRPRSIYDVMAAIGCFAALATGTAYAANTVFSSDIVDGEVKSVDIGNNEIGSSDVKDNSLNTFDVHSFLGVDVVDGTLTGADVADTSSLGANDINEELLFFNNTLGAADLAGSSVGASEVSNGTLKDEDVGQATFVDFLATIGPVAAQGCAYLPITGINATGDHLLLTPSSVDAAAGLIYDVQYRQGQESAFLQACNNNDVVIDDGTTHFNLLVFDAQ